MAWIGKHGTGIVLKNNLIIFGGTFDPPHLGHLNTALAVQKHMQFERFLFLPCKFPVLKKNTTASSEQRIQMLELMLLSYPEFEIDLREIQRPTPSFMVDTLQSFRDDLGNEISITLLLGMDAFLQLPQWHAWEKILELCHLLVMKRIHIHESNILSPVLPSVTRDLPALTSIAISGDLSSQAPREDRRATASKELESTLKAHEIFDKTQLLTYPCGKIYQYNAGEYAISSSQLRQKMAAAEDVKGYLSERVFWYINEHKIYL